MSYEGHHHHISLKHIIDPQIIHNTRVQVVQVTQIVSNICHITSQPRMSSQAPITIFRLNSDEMPLAPFHSINLQLKMK